MFLNCVELKIILNLKTNYEYSSSHSLHLCSKEFILRKLLMTIIFIRIEILLHSLFESCDIHISKIILQIQSGFS